MSTPNLMLHCGASAVDRLDIGNVILPPTTRTYCPVGHDTLLDLVEDKMSEVGFHFGTEAHGMTKNGDRYFGLIHLLNGSNSEDHALVMGVRNSLDKKFPAQLAFGSQVFVCDNLAFTGEITVGRKHTTNIMRDLPNLIGAAVSNTAAMRDNQDQRFETYKHSTLTDLRAHNLIIELLRLGAINTSRVKKVVEQWHDPIHDFGGKTVWRLFNAVTEALKGSPLHDMPNRTIEMQAVCDRTTNFVPHFQMA
jgi:hypothetical protein